MGYLHIPNLYKNTEILLFKECYAMEKIHGTSTHIQWKDGKIRFFSGGEKHEKFINLFNEQFLINKFTELFGVEESNIIIYGEAYGGKQQGMSHTYGKELKFIVFDVKIDDNWLDVPNAEDVTKKFNLDFVFYNKIKTDMNLLNFERDSDSIQAIRNGCGIGKMREGIVLRPLIEVKKNNGDRIIVKHKRDEFIETRTKREVDPKKLKVIEDAKAIAKEWVTLMRLTHVLDKLNNPTEIEKTGIVIKAMIEDIRREAKGEIVESKQAIQAIGKSTAKLFKQKISKI